MTVLINTFHNTTATARYSHHQLDNIEMRQATTPHTITNAEQSLIYRIRKQLCGIKTCLCGDFWGARTQ